MNAIAKMLKASPSTILDWIRKFAGDHAKPPEPQGTEAIVLELDQIRESGTLYHYLGENSRKRFRANEYLLSSSRYIIIL